VHWYLHKSRIASILRTSSRIGAVYELLSGRAVLRRSSAVGDDVKDLGMADPLLVGFLF